MNSQQQGNAELRSTEQEYGDNPLDVRETDHYRKEYITSFVDKWDELIDWRRRAETEGQFFIDILRARGKQKVLDAACGTGFHSVRLAESGFDVTVAVRWPSSTPRSSTMASSYWISATTTPCSTGASPPSTNIITAATR